MLVLETVVPQFIKIVLNFLLVDFFVYSVVDFQMVLKLMEIVI